MSYALARLEISPSTEIREVSEPVGRIMAIRFVVGSTRWSPSPVSTNRARSIAPPLLQIVYNMSACILAPRAMRTQEVPWRAGILTNVG